MTRFSIGFLLALSLLSAVLVPAGYASPHPALHAGVSLGSTPSLGRSRGYPWKGKLVSGVRLQESPSLRYVDVYREADNFFGTQQLVGALERAAQYVGTRYPGAKLGVGELSAERGGRLPQHHSHQSGRDVDVAFYAKSKETGEPVESPDFVRFWATGDGAGRDQDKTFDDARNWALVHSLLTDPHARVQFLFVSDTLRRRLLRQGVREGASVEVLERAATALRAPSGRHPHKNHFHVRIYCPQGDRPHCRERGPFFEWYEGEPPWGLTTPSRRPPWLRAMVMPR